MKSKLFLILVVGSTMFAFMLNTFSQNSSQWHLPEGAILRLGKGAVRNIEYSPDGTRLAVSSTVGIWLYDAETGEELDLLTGQRGIILWDADTGQHLRSATHILELAEPGRGTRVALSQNGKVLATGSENMPEPIFIIHLWDVDTGQHLRTIRIDKNMYIHTPVQYLGLSPDGKKIVILSDVQYLLWDVDTGKTTSLKLRQGYADVSYRRVTFSPDGKTIANGYPYSEIYIWDTNTGKILRTLTGHTSFVKSVAFSSDGKTIVSGSEDKTLKLWDVETGEQIRTIRGHRDVVRSVAFNPDGKTIVSGSYDSTLKFWDVDTGEHLRTIMGHTYGSVNSVVFSPDGKKIVSGGEDGLIYLWYTDTGDLIDPRGGHWYPIRSVAFSPDGKKS